jgi:hypothetical protein
VAAIEQIKADRAAKEAAAAEELDKERSAARDAETKAAVQGWQRPEPAPAGAGIVLGVLVWAVARSYIEGGVPRVRKLLRAKFLNQTTS